MLDGGFFNMSHKIQTQNTSWLIKQTKMQNKAQIAWNPTQSDTKTRQQKMACKTPCKTTIEKNYLLTRVQSTHAHPFIGAQTDEKKSDKCMQNAFWQRG